MQKSPNFQWAPYFEIKTQLGYINDNPLSGWLDTMGGYYLKRAFRLYFLINHNTVNIWTPEVSSHGIFLLVLWFCYLCVRCGCWPDNHHRCLSKNSILFDGIYLVLDIMHFCCQKNSYWLYILHRKIEVSTNRRDLIRGEVEKRWRRLRDLSKEVLDHELDNGERISEVFFSNIGFFCKSRNVLLQ